MNSAVPTTRWGPVVRVGQRPGHLLEQPRGRVVRHRTPFSYPPPERVSVDVRHREVHQVRDLMYREDGDDAGMRELSGGPGLAQEALPRGRLDRAVGGQQLDSDP